MFKWLTKIFHRSLLVFVLATVVSCSSTRSVTIEIPVDPENRLPDSIQSFVIVSRTIDSTQFVFEEDSLQRFFYKKNFDFDTTLIDLKSVDTLLQATGELLYESGRFDIVIPQDRFLSAKRNAFINEPMRKEQIKELCESYQVNAVLSLDHFQTHILTNLVSEYFFEEGIDDYLEVYKAEMKIGYDGLFTIYVPDQNLNAGRMFIRDTLFWEEYSTSSINSLFRRFTTVKEGLIEAGIAFALDYTEKISPGWQSTRRVYFSSGNSDMKHASTLADNNNWQAAKGIWKQIANSSKSKNLKSRAEFNMAVAFEIEGNTKDATLWALKSYETMYRPLTYKYLEILKQRLKNTR